MGSAAITSADDGARLVRSVSSAPGQTESPEPEAEHAFTAVMNFRVPAQKSSGELTTINYCTADEGVNCESADVTSDTAKPLVNFYVYGPVISFEDFAQSGFAGHGRRDAFAAVSLDDGQTWKRTNLSNSGDKSSFTVSTPIPNPGFTQPEVEVTSDTPIVTSALFAGLGTKGILTIAGTDAARRSIVEIRNAITHDLVGTATATFNGKFSLTLRNPEEVPCSVQAGYTDGNVWGPYLNVAGANLETCTGPADPTLTDEYPGDVTNGVHAVAGNGVPGNKILAAWQSKFCQGGSPVWSAEFPRDEVATYLGLDMASDLYLVDLFGVAGSQRSVDYREQEEFPGEYDSVGEVPYNCLWSARGVLRENPEELGTTQIVWFQAERLTSGRRDVNRIEVACTAPPRSRSDRTTS